MRSDLPLTVVDAFTDRPFAGNPAGVCLLPAGDWPDTAWMQAVAAEMKHSETAFLKPRPDGAYDLRWLTPAVEVDLCGHATLASAHTLWESGRAAASAELVFHTRSGALSCRLAEGRIWMDFPAKEALACPDPALTAEIAEALGTAVTWLGHNRMDYLALVEATVLRRLTPDQARLRSLPVRGVIATAPADGPDHDFLSRFFAPGAGVDEDPVTGSAHCALGPFWGARLGKTRLRGFQCSARGGRVEVEWRGARVGLGGHAVTVLEGRLRAGG